MDLVCIVIFEIEYSTISAAIHTILMTRRSATVFEELMPLLTERVLVETLSRVRADEICINVIPERVRETYTHLYPEIATAAMRDLKRLLANWSTSLFAGSGRKGETQTGLLGPR